MGQVVVAGKDMDVEILAAEMKRIDIKVGKTSVGDIIALLFPSHIFCSVFIGVRSGCLNHKSSTIWSVTCSA